MEFGWDYFIYFFFPFDQDKAPLTEVAGELEAGDPVWD